MLERIDHTLSRIPFIKKIMIIFLGSTLIPLFIQTFYNLSLTENNIQSEFTHRLESTLNDRTWQINTEMSDAVSISLKYNNNEYCYRLMDKEYETDYSYFVVYQKEISKLIRTELLYHPQVENIIFFSDNPTLFNGAFLRQVKDINDTSEQENLLNYHDVSLGSENTGIYLRTGIKKTQASATVEREVSIVRNLHFYPEFSNTAKKMKISLNSTFFSRILSETEMFDGLYLVDEENRILFSSDNPDNISATINKFDPKSFSKDYVIMQKNIGGFSLKLYGIYNPEMVSGEFSKSRIDAIFIFLTGLSIALICVLFVGNNITNRAAGIVYQASEIAKGNFIQSESAQYSEDELGMVEKSINLLSEQLQTLIDKEYKAELERAKLESETNNAKLQALQSQVNPHFLFNALESIRMKALSKDELETATMIKYMSKMFRHIIDWSEEIVPLSEDLKFLDEFLSIQKYRFGTDFNYDIQVDTGAENIYLPKMIIQPLVENACVHGAESISEQRWVALQITLEKDYLVIQVKDNGGGISADKLKKIKDMLAGGESNYKSVGLNNVYQRLKLHYKDNFTFDIISTLGEGTLCIVKIPLENEQSR